MGFDRRQPSQDFGPTIGDRKVMTVMHVEAIGAMSKGDGITILAAGSIENIAIVILRVGSVDRNIVSTRIRIMEELGNEGRIWRPIYCASRSNSGGGRKVGFITDC